MGTNITVRYPFHPLYGQTLAVTSMARRADGALTVAAPDGSHLKLPVWMTVPEAEGHSVSREVAISSRALLNLLEVVAAATGGSPHPLPSSSTPGDAMLDDTNRRTSKAGGAHSKRAGCKGRKHETTELGIGEGSHGAGDAPARGHRAGGDRAARGGNQGGMRKGGGGRR